jgi:hypothetical protein
VVDQELGELDAHQTATEDDDPLADRHVDVGELGHPLGVARDPDASGHPHAHATEERQLAHRLP